MRSAVQSVLGVGDEEAIDICLTRLLDHTRTTTMSQEIATMDAAIETFDFNDQDEVHRQQVSSHNRTIDKEVFSKHYVDAKQAAVAARIKKKAKVPAKYAPMPREIKQADAKMAP